MGAGVKPGIDPPQTLDIQLTGLAIDVQKVSDFIIIVFIPPFSGRVETFSLKVMKAISNSIDTSVG